jgi:antibiotic biosynthesis monooxygenase (ABM) superfamily enzyme
MTTQPLYILVKLWVRSGREAEFEVYERKVSRIMARYDGVIERAIRVARTSSDVSDEPFEVHVLKFPNRDLYDAFRDDAERRSLSGERARIITKADVLVGTPGPSLTSATVNGSSPERSLW